MTHKSKTVLIVDDDEGMRDTLTAILKREYRVLRVSSGEAALQVLNKEDVDLVLLDVRLPGISGFEVLRIVKENYSLIEVLMISAIQEIETAVQAMKHGAYHYIAKDFDYDQLRSLVRNASERQDLNRQVLTLSAQVADQTEREFVVGSSKMTRDIVDLVHKVAKLSATVLILGESGTGKELLARLIHREAGDPDAPFIAVNLAAIPRELAESTLFGHERGAFTGAHRQQLGKFELASNGTLFLDEIGDLRREGEDLPIQILSFAGIANERSKLVVVEVLGDVVVSAVLHGLHGRLDLIDGRDHDDLDQRVVLPDDAQHLETADAGQSHVEQDKVDVLPVEER